MLTDKHITILRAALQFFSEEVCPHGEDAIADYVAGITPEEVTELQRLMAGCRVVGSDPESRTTTLSFTDAND